jgi:hypothetical protein
MITIQRRLAVYGPLAAHVGAGSLLVFFFFQQFGGAIATAIPALYIPSLIVFDLAFWVWLVAFAVVVFDIERLAQTTNSAHSFQVARWATIIAMIVPILLFIAQILYSSVLMPLSYLTIFGCVGISLILHNFAARGARLLHGALPWLGVVTAVAYILAAIGFGTLLLPIGATSFMIGFNVLLLGEVLYIAWAIWIGVKLSRSKVAAPAAVA